MPRKALAKFRKLVPEGTKFMFVYNRVDLGIVDENGKAQYTSTPGVRMRLRKYTKSWMYFEYLDSKHEDVVMKVPEDADIEVISGKYIIVNQPELKGMAGTSAMHKRKAEKVPAYTVLVIDEE